MTITRKLRSISMWLKIFTVKKTAKNEGLTI